MDHAAFDLVVQNRCEKIRSVLASKAEEYAREGSDRLVAFKRMAAFRNTTPERALFDAAAKHIVALAMFIDEDPNSIPPAQWEEKIGDTINYMVLLEALLRERGAM